MGTAARIGATNTRARELLSLSRSLALAHRSGCKGVFAPTLTTFLLPYRLREGYHEGKRCSRDTYPESYITKCTSVRRLSVGTPLCLYGFAYHRVQGSSTSVLFKKSITARWTTTFFKKNNSPREIDFQPISATILITILADSGGP